jgi:hypothetical protein
MPGAEDDPANRRQGDSREAADHLLEEMLRQIGADILDEDVPERLRRVLRPKTGSDNGARGHPPTRADGTGRDDEPSG